jgi:hypothetical protein
MFAGDGGQEIARDFKVSLLGQIPMDPVLVHVFDLGWKKWQTISMK